MKFTLFLIFFISGTLHVNEIAYTNNEIIAYSFSTTQDKVERLCVQYKTRNGWSKNYRVEVRTIKGSELNRRTNTFNYNSYSSYAVIFWSNNQASIIELSFYTGSYGPMPTSGKDQRGMSWRLSKSSICY